MLLRRGLILLIPVSACATVAEERAPRYRHDNEAFFVSLAERGRIYEMRLPDKRIVQAFAAMVYNVRRQPWSSLGDSLRKQLVSGAIDPLSGTAYSDRKVFLLPLVLPVPDRPIETLGRDSSVNFGARESLAEIEGRFLAGLDAASKEFEAVLIACVPAETDTAPCIKPPNAYTLIIGDQWSDASALKLSSGKQSKLVSGVLGTAFILGVFWFTVF